MNHTYFITGFPGFISRQLIKELRNSQFKVERIYVLVLPQLVQRAKAELDEITQQGQWPDHSFVVCEGDITQDHLGLHADQLAVLQDEVTHVYHLAAVYDLAVTYETAYRVNVIGTRHVNEWVQSLRKLQRYIYFSTAYVSGRREGVILEQELDCNQSFKNHYESTKYEAEKAVRELFGKVATTIIRPGIVMGNSQTGETAKFDGPYFMLNMMDRLSWLPFTPYIGHGTAKGNFVPVDYIFAAVLYLSHHAVGVDKTYHLTDPNPYRMKEVYGMLMKAYLGKEPKGTLPLAVVKPLMKLSWMRRWLRVEQEGLDYFECEADYDCSEALRDLQGAGIQCPDFKEVLQPMVAYYRLYKNDQKKQLNIK